jgi:uncharacterized membrane protein HdeD (DUF308 family)
MSLGAEERAMARSVGPWWVFLVTGVAWMLISLAVLQFDLTSVRSISILLGVVLLVAGANELFIGMSRKSWRWAHLALGVLFLAGGVLAFVWPGKTFLVLARLVGWFLLFKGTADITLSFAERRISDLWWLRLVTGIMEVGLAFWVVGSLTRSAALLVLWVGLAALFRGITELIFAFTVRSAAREEAPARGIPGGPPWPSNVPGAERPGASAAHDVQPSPERAPGAEQGIRPEQRRPGTPRQ